MKVMLVAGARPNFMKIASLIAAIREYNERGNRLINAILVHTGQHYDDQMSEAFFRDLDLPQPDINLGVGSGSHAAQTADIMRRFEPIVLQEKPHIVLVVGDVNSTLACSIVTSKLYYSEPTVRSQSRPLLGHVEAGLRSFDRTMPEEINRIVTDSLSDYLFTSEESAERNLLNEGIPLNKIYFVGNTMVDTLLKHRRKASKSRILEKLGLEHHHSKSRSPSTLSYQNEKYAVVTLHRPSNVDNEETLKAILQALNVIAKKMPVFLPLHPRTLGQIRKFRLETHCVFVQQNRVRKKETKRLICLEPLTYLDFLCLMSNATLVLTDSGGIQEETTALGVPCVTLRDNTERPVTVTEGTNVLAGNKPDDIVSLALNRIEQSAQPERPRYWDGHAGERIIEVLVRSITPSSKARL
jgi:UDP-N-acetylglucosamine 2-epimerase (non-hydrolysing)